MNKIMKNTPAALLGATLLIWGSQASAAVIVTDTSTVVSIPGLTGFMTTGSDMAGMTVQAIFADGTDETLAWATTGLEAGAVNGTNWSLTEVGDTFTTPTPWTFTNATGSALLELNFNGAPGLTLFDITWNDGGDIIGTPGSAEGIDFSTSLANDGSVVATYSNAVQIGAAAAVGDIFHNLNVDFRNASATDTTFLITQDTDNDERINQVPEPATLALLGLGLGWAGFRRKK